MLDQKRIRRGFERAAPGFDAHDFLHREIRGRLLERLLAVRIVPNLVVDLGAGTGYFSVPMAQLAPAGRVLAIDLQPEMLDIIRTRTANEEIDNIEPILATEQDPNLPAGTVDLVLIVDAYHEFYYPKEVMTNVLTGLKPGGRVYLVEYRAEDPRVPIKRLHKMTEAQARRELEAVGLRWVETLGFLPQQHVLVFERPM